MTTQSAQIAQLTAEVDTLKTALSRRRHDDDDSQDAAETSSITDQEKDARIAILEQKLADLRG